MSRLFRRARSRPRLFYPVFASVVLISVVSFVSLYPRILIVFQLKQYNLDDSPDGLGGLIINLMLLTLMISVLAAGVVMFQKAFAGGSQRAAGRTFGRRRRPKPDDQG